MELELDVEVSGEGVEPQPPGEQGEHQNDQEHVEHGATLHPRSSVRTQIEGFPSRAMALWRGTRPMAARFLQNWSEMIESKPTLEDLRAIRYRCQCVGECGTHKGLCGAIQGDTFQAGTVRRSFVLKKLSDGHQERICCQRCRQVVRDSR